MAQATAEKLEHTGLLKRKEWPQCHRESSWQERRSRPCQKEKKQSRLSKAPDHEGGETQGGREPHLGGSGGLHGERGQIPRRTGSSSKKSLPRTSRRKHERVSGRKSSPGRSAESSGQT